MFLRIKTIEEFEKTCLRDYDGYVIDENDFFKFPLGSEFWNDLIGKRVEVKKEGYYTRQGVSYQLYRMKKNKNLVPYWFFSESKKGSLKIE